MKTLDTRCANISVVVAAAFAAMPSVAAEADFFGLLRARDLTPLGFLRLDMRPAHAVSIEPGSWALETELAYQNTWALSPEVERYLTALEMQGRRELGAAELQAIRALPGENYLIDAESAVFDLTLHYKVSPNVSTYLITNVVSYQGGFLDSAIEGFHDEFGFSSFGRPAASRDDFNLIYDLKSSQTAYFSAPTKGGFSDPTIGIRYSGLQLPERWSIAVEAAAKVPVAGRRSFLSTGRADYGIQASFQRRGNHHAFYTDIAAVYYAGAHDPSPQDAQIIPTLIFGYEYKLTARTNLNLQGYVSTSVYSHDQTDLKELLGEKYQLTIGLRHIRDSMLLTFGVTENLQNINNTPDIGFQFGVAWIPRRSSR